GWIIRNVELRAGVCEFGTTCADGTQVQVGALPQNGGLFRCAGKVTRRPSARRTRPCASRDCLATEKSTSPLATGTFFAEGKEALWSGGPARAARPGASTNAQNRGRILAIRRRGI